LLRRRAMATAAVLVWLAVGIGPSLAILMKIPEVPVAERYLYFPSVAFCLITGQAIALAWRVRHAAARWTAGGLGIAVLAWCASASAARNRVWQSDTRLWTDTTAKSLTAGLPFRSLAATLAAGGHTQEAVAMYHLALEKRNNENGKATIHNNLGTIALMNGDLKTAEQHYQQAVTIHPSADCLFNLGVVSLTRARQAGERGDLDARQREATNALPHLQRAERISRFDPDIQAALGQTLLFLGKPNDARLHFERALSLGLGGSTAEQIRRLLAQPPSQ